MGRLSLAIGRQKEGGRPKNLRASLKGLLRMPASDRSSVSFGDLGDLGDLDGHADFEDYDDYGVADDDDGGGGGGQSGGRAMAQPASPDTPLPAQAQAEHQHRGFDAPVIAGDRHAHADITTRALRECKSGDGERSGWRRRGSMLGSRLAGPLRREASSSNASIGSAGARSIPHRDSTPQLGRRDKDLPPPPPAAAAAGQRSSHQRLASHPEDAEAPPFWRSSSPLRVAAIDASAAAERTHRSPSVPSIGPPSHQLASPYLRAVSSGLGRQSQSQSQSPGAMRHRGPPRGFASSRQSQDRLPGSLSLAGSYEGVGSPPCTPIHAPLAAAAAAADRAASLPMTFLVSPRPRADSGARYSLVVAQPLSHHHPAPHHPNNLSKRTLSSSTIPSLDLNTTPASPKALAGAVDVSEFGVGSSASTAAAPAQSAPPTPASVAFGPPREGPAGADADAGAGAGAAPGSQQLHPCPDPFCPSAAQNAVHETHHMEVQHDPRTGRKMINQYMIIRELGRGTHGKVKLAFDTLSGEYYAIKVIDKESRDRRLRPAPPPPLALAHGQRSRRSHGHLRIDVERMEKVKREIAILKKCRHPHVVRLHEVIDDAHARRIYLVIEYMDGGEVAWRDADHLPVMSADKARSVFRDLVLGVEYLHFAGILHRDLKPQNLLCNKAGTVKISDFGVSFLRRRHHLHSRPASTTTATAPPGHHDHDHLHHHHHHYHHHPLHHCTSQPLMGAANVPEHLSQRARACRDRQSLGQRLGQMHIHHHPHHHHHQHPARQAVRRPATIGMTDEFGAPLQQTPALPADSPDQSPVGKLPPEFMSADSSVYDPFDSSDSDEFFSSSDEGGGNNESRYGSECATEPAETAPDNNNNNDDDDGAESDGGIVFGVLPPSAREDGEEGDAAAGAVGSFGRHQRKGTLGEIVVSCTEEDEERELAKTAGTPAFFAPELCCMPDELAKVLRQHRQAAAAATSDAHAATAPVAPSPSGRSHTAHPAVHAGSDERRAAAPRPASMFFESPAASDDSRNNLSKAAKRHSTLTSLLARPFSSRGRPSSCSSTHSSTATGPAATATPAATPTAATATATAAAAVSPDELDQPLPANLITPAIDIWAMGVTLYCLVYGRVPFQASTEFELFSIIPRQPLDFPQQLEVVESEGGPAMGLLDAPDDNSIAATRKRVVPLPPLDPDLRDLLLRMLDKDFRTRITLDEIKRHPWVIRGLERPASWAKETDPARRPSVTITTQEVEQAMVPKVHRRRRGSGGGFRASVRRRISLLSPRAPRDQRTATAKAKSSLDWLKLWGT
ncbi:hypothetical protein H4R18_001857 [Coemansia javaensis]|uniref:Protein kinase domain-containing protein n=1 Tax=Coemansia javaensis TaxID=2761396 RepID=A0A9W8LKY2_9FUNG|nr:hypothetical protein H4R18_001857 [Coemansia javaensis]